MTTMPAIHQLKSFGGADGVSTIKVVKIQTGVARKSASNTNLGSGVSIFPIQYPVTRGQIIRTAHVNPVMIDSRIRFDDASEAVCPQLGARSGGDDPSGENGRIADFPLKGTRHYLLTRSAINLGPTSRHDCGQACS